MTLNEGQKRAADIVLGGQTCFLSGPGGTGKSYLIHHLYTELLTRGFGVAVTALTGCAALLLAHVKAKTLHSWAGVGLAREPATVLAANIKKYGGKSLRNWLLTDTLIIDEISMADPEFLDKLNEIGKIVRRSSKPFGGIQIVFVGDFYQLPPVQKRVEGGEEPLMTFAFESNAWKECAPRVICLTQIVRQADPVFQTLLNEARRGGTLSDPSIRLLQDRQREEWTDLVIKPTLLFSRRAEVDMINMKNLKALLKDTATFYKPHTVFTDAFPKDLDKKSEKVQRAIAKLDLNAPYHPDLELRVGAQVMLVYNLDVEDGLVNGSRGVITGFCETLPKLPMVQFVNHSAPIKIGECTWESEDISGLKRLQIPLICAWAITIHKAQGATLDSALIDIGPSTFEKGQAYVALSRVRSLDSLYVYDLDPEAFKSHPKVTAFYDSLPPDSDALPPPKEAPKHVNLENVPKTKKGDACQNCLLRMERGLGACSSHASAQTATYDFVEEAPKKGASTTTAKEGFMTLFGKPTVGAR